MHNHANTPPLSFLQAGCPSYHPTNRAIALKAYYILITHTHTHPFNGSFSRPTWVSRYQKGKTNLDLTEARDSEWQWHQLGHMQVCTSLQADNHASTAPLKFFYRSDALPVTQPTASKHWMSIHTDNLTNNLVGYQFVIAVIVSNNYGIMVHNTVDVSWECLY